MPRITRFDQGLPSLEVVAHYKRKRRRERRGRSGCRHPSQQALVEPPAALSDLCPSCFSIAIANARMARAPCGLEHCGCHFAEACDACLEQAQYFQGRRLPTYG